MIDGHDPSAQLAAELDRALERHELTAHFQPQYDLATGRVVALEALCRWSHPDLGLVPPTRFIPIAERYDLIERLGEYMLDHSGRQARAWVERGIRVGLAINVSPSEIGLSFADRIIVHLQHLGLPADSVTLEIIESPAMRETPEELAAIGRLLDAGVGISIDDFGAGHTTLESLARIPFTEVKIDRRLTHDASAATDELVRAAVHIARGREAHVVVEGIETAQHLERARAWGCDRGQGYFLAPPLPPEAIEPILLDASR